MKLGLVAERPRIGDVRGNLAVVEKHLQSVDADLVVFGELFLSGYPAKDAFVNAAMSIDGPEVGQLRDACRAHKRGLVVGFPRRDTDRRGVMYDSALVIDARGNPGYYDKWFPANFGPFEERLFFAQGNDLPLFDQGGMKFGVQICYDLFFPEISKAYAMQGADLLINISASPSTSRKNFELVFPARAIENAYFVAYTNLAGTQEDLVFWGGQQVWGPRGDRKAVGSFVDPSVLVCEIDPKEIDAARPLRPTIRDTRPELLHRLAMSAARDSSRMNASNGILKTGTLVPGRER